MTDLVASAEIESIVGVKRDHLLHWGRAVSDDDTVYILHSQECLDSGVDLRRCAFSRALNKGINENRWCEDVALPLLVLHHLAVDEDSLVESTTELVPAGDPFAGLNEAEWLRFKSERRDMQSRGYVDLSELQHPTRHPEPDVIRVGARVHHHNERYYEARRNGTAIILALMEKPNSPWAKDWGRRDIELLVLTDRDRFETGNRIGRWADYHTRLPIGDFS